MAKNKTQNNYYEIVIYNDNSTPFDFVAKLINHLTGVPLYECEELARRIDALGSHSLGPYPEPVAKAIISEAELIIKKEGHALNLEVLNIRNPESSEISECSFCGKMSTVVDKMFDGATGFICGDCVLARAGELQDELPTAKLYYIYQLLDLHFGKVSKDKFVRTCRNYPARVRADLQTALEELFNPKAIRSVGIKQQSSREKIDLATLWAAHRGSLAISPVSFEEVDVGEPMPIRCQLNGIWLLQEGNEKYVAILSREVDYCRTLTIFLEISGPQGERTEQITRKIFDSIEETIRQAQNYRGKVLSLETPTPYSGSSNGINVHKIPPVARDQIILPRATLDALDRTIIEFCKNRDQLRALGLQTKRGVMFYGPPGTGKTHTIRYLASELTNHTTFLITAEQIGLLPEYFSLARLLQPAIFVIEDADLLAKSRESIHTLIGEALLNRLLNEMDGLQEDADILFILSTNRPETLEEALVSRPGRIDQLIEFPKPDEKCRLRLLKLYGGSLKIDNKLHDKIINRTDGVSGAFIKELARRLAQYSIERNANGKIIEQDVDQALTEMLFDNNALNRAILGADEPDKSKLH